MIFLFCPIIYIFSCIYKSIQFFIIYRNCWFFSLHSSVFLGFFRILSFAIFSILNIFDNLFDLFFLFLLFFVPFIHFLNRLPHFLGCPWVFNCLWSSFFIYLFNWRHSKIKVWISFFYFNRLCLSFVALVRVLNRITEF